MTKGPTHARVRHDGAGRVALLAALAAGCSSSHASSPSASKEAAIEPPSWELTGRYKPSIDPANFVATIDNPYFPLEPGTAFHYTGMSEGTPQTDDMVVTDRTKQILGVTATVVEDTVSEHGKAIERTFDWYAQDKQGNVWYMGEDSLELHHGRLVRASDSWEAGVDGAQPGIIMQANPKAGDVYQQEYYRPVRRSTKHTFADSNQRERAVRRLQAGPRHGGVESRGAAVGAEVLRCRASARSRSV